MHPPLAAEGLLRSHHFHLRPPGAALLVAACLASVWPPTAAARRPEGECAPPRTRIALCALVDATDRSWAAWTGEQPAALVGRRLADSLAQAHGRDVVHVGRSSDGATRPLEDETALELGRSARAEVVITGVLAEFVHDDHREPGKFSRWGVGAPDARSFAGVRVTLRALDTADGSVILETTVARERRGRSTASAGRPRTAPAPDSPSGPLAEALDEVVSDLARTLDRRFTDRWRANVLLATSERCLLDAGAGHGLFAGERLEVWRAGIETWDEDFTRLGEEVRVGVVLVTGFEGRDRAHARVLEGEVRPGDRVRPCTAAAPPPVSLRR